MAKKVGSASQQEPEAGQATGISMADLGVTDGVGPANLPRLDPRPAALFIFHPERWMVSHGSVVPCLGRLAVEGGVGNVKVVDEKRGKLSLSTAIAEKQKRGWSVIPLDVDGPGTSYLQSPIPGVYLTRWETAHAGSSVVTSDGAGYVRWLCSLVDRGVVPKAPPYVLERMRSRVKSEIADLQDRVRTVPSVQTTLDRKLADLEVIDQELGSAPLTPLAQKPAGLGEHVSE